MEWSLSFVSGFIASLLLAVQTGLPLSFNVYAVELKRVFSLNQTQVELIGSFTIGGAATGIAGIFIINRYGYRACYVFAGFMILASGLLTWLTALYADAFQGHVAVLCVLQLLGSSGMVNAHNCITAIGILQFSKRHTGKMIGFYTSSMYAGTIYYSATYNTFFQFDGGFGWFYFFITVAGIIPFIFSLLFHMPPETDQESQVLTQNPSKDQTEEMTARQNYTEVKEEGSNEEPLTVTQILRSSVFHLVIWPNVLFQSCGFSFMNNVTSIAASLQIVHPEITIYIITVGIIVSRISLSVVFDLYGTKLAGLVLFLICSISFSAAMFVGVIWLNPISIYFITLLAAIGIGPLYSLTLGLLTLNCGSHHFILITALYGLGISCFACIIEILIGMTYDYAFQMLNTTTFLCVDCFHWTFLILTGSSVLYFIFQSANIFITVRQQ